MTYESVDKLQKTLARDVFHYTKDSKKAAGRALGTIVEIISFYILKIWELSNSISIEKKIPEYGNPDITHNVEYSLHPIYDEYAFNISNSKSSITANQIMRKLSEVIDISDFNKTNNNLLTKDGVLRNSCTIATSNTCNLVAFAKNIKRKNIQITVVKQSNKPYAIFECKRVGVEEGMKKGPQTIEKAKQGAYVARAVSALQKNRLHSGEAYGIIYQGSKVLYSEPYNKLLERVIYSKKIELLKDFILTIGVVSNHGNWFTADDHNKELKVLAQSYDWLLFLSDAGIVEFVNDLLLNPSSEYKVIKKAFLSSYRSNKKKNQFTKVQMNINADIALIKYFSKNLKSIEKWFNIITPHSKNLKHLRNEIKVLHSKPWKEVL